MDWTALVGSIFSGVIALVVSIVNSNAQLRKADNEQDKRMIELQAALNQNIALIECKMDSLTSEVREHNNFAKRMPLVEERLEVLTKRVETLEKKGA